MRRVRVTAYVPVRLPFPFEKHRESAEACISELISSSNKIVFDLGPLGKSPLVINHSKSRLAAGALGLGKIPDHIEHSLLSMSAAFSFGKTLYYESSKGLEGVNLVDLQNRMLMTEVFQSIYRLAIAINIAVPGAFQIGDSLCVAGRYSQEVFSGLHNDLDLSVSVAKSQNWPPIEHLSIVKAWNWLSGFKEFNFGFSRSKLGRTLNAFSYLFTSKPASSISPIDDLWALIGLEALLSTGLGIQREVREKIELLLGAQESRKNEFKEAYKVRSGLVHGGLDFPSSIFIYDGAEVYEKFRKSATNAYRATTAIFLSVLQLMCKNEWYEIEFHYAVNGGKN